MAKFGVQGRWEAEVALGGVPLALSHQTLHYLCVSSAVTMPMPRAVLTVLDQGADFVTRIGVGDGMPLQISMSDGCGGPTFQGDFVVSGGPTAYYSKKGVTFTINAMLNKMGYLRKVNNSAAKDTSGGMISKLLQSAGITNIDIDPTADTQAWLPQGMPIAKRVGEIASRAWAGPMSAMVHCLDENGRFRFKDLSTLALAPPMAQYGGLFKDPTLPHGGNGILPVLQFELKSMQGLYNNAAGYGATAIVEGLSGKMGIGQGEALSLDDLGGIGGLLDGLSSALGGAATVMMDAGSGSLNISSELQKAIGPLGSKQFLPPLSSGNSHANYHRAAIQNMRGKAAFGNDVVLLSTQAGGISLLDPLYFHCTNPYSGIDIPMFSGKYLVTAKDMIITGQGQKAGYGYWEKLTGSSNSGGVPSA